LQDLETSVQVLGINGGAFTKPPAVVSSAQKGKAVADSLEADISKRLRWFSNLESDLVQYASAG